MIFNAHFFSPLVGFKDSSVLPHLSFAPIGSAGDYRMGDANGLLFGARRSDIVCPSNRGRRASK